MKRYQVKTRRKVWQDWTYFVTASDEVEAATKVVQGYYEASNIEREVEHGNEVREVEEFIPRGSEESE